MDDDLTPAQQTLREMTPWKRRLIYAVLFVWIVTIALIARASQSPTLAIGFMVGSIVLFTLIAWAWGRLRRSG